MNEQDLNILKSFAQMAIEYLGEDELYDTTQLWQHLDNCVQLKRRMRKLRPFIDSIVNRVDAPKN